MSNIATLVSGEEFADPFSISWRQHPEAGPLATPQVLTPALQNFEYVECDIRIDLAGPPVTLSRCGPQTFNFNFHTGDGVLLGDAVPGADPLHLVFSPGLKALGAQVSGVGLVDTPYVARLKVRLSDGTWEGPASRWGMLNQVRGSAPFVGVVATNGLAIVEAIFDAKSLDPAHEFLQVGINDLYFDPL